MTAPPAFGRPMRRKEDPRLLTGRGKYVADFRLLGMLHAAVLRSPHAHARLGAVRTKAALALSGVVAVVTADDLGAVGRIPLRLGARPGVAACLQPPLARDKVRYVGEPVALVVADSRYVAEDALDLMEVD
jgi:carbon-monoxide dehydrogenase large subunit